MFDRLDRLANSRRVLIALAAVIVLFTLANLSSTLFAAATGAGILDLSGGRNILDMRAGLTSDGVYQLIGSYGPDGRTYHLLITLLSDILLPAAVFLFGALGLLHATRRLRLQPRWRRLAVALPVGYLVADYAENIGIVTLLLGYPSHLTPVAAVTVVFTAAKSVLIAATVLAVAATYTAGLVRRAPSPALGTSR